MGFKAIRFGENDCGKKIETYFIYHLDLRKDVSGLSQSMERSTLLSSSPHSYLERRRFFLTPSKSTQRRSNSIPNIDYSISTLNSDTPFKITASESLKTN